MPIIIATLFLCALTRMAGAQTGNQESRRPNGFHLSPEKYEKAVAFSRTKYRLHFAEVAYGILVLMGLLSARVAPKYRDWAERVSHKRFVQAWIFGALILFTLGLFSLPVEIYRQWLSRKYDQSIQDWASWSWDWTKGQLLTTALGAVLLWILYGMIRRSPRWWWFYFWLVSIPIVVFLMFISPLVIEPLFFKFEPLAKKHPELVAQISRIVRRAGLTIPEQRMFEMNASEKMNSVNAYVSGVGASKRVVVWDTTMKRLNNDQTLFVFGHEMGHYVLGHIPKLILFLCALMLVFLYVGARGANWLLRKSGARWDIRGIDDWASLPVFLLFLTGLSFLAEPLINAMSRHYEHQADIYGLEVIHGIVPHSTAAAAQAFQVLGEVNLSDPRPSRFIELWLYNHPPLDKRILFAKKYDPWRAGHPEFVK